MTIDWQTPAALAIAFISAGWLARSWWMKRKKPGCGGGCGCPTNEFKAKLKR